jgi:hypothetical protein
VITHTFECGISSSTLNNRAGALSDETLKLNQFGTLVVRQAPIAQWIEQLPSKQWVGGSSPLGRAKFKHFLSHA